VTNGVRVGFSLVNRRPQLDKPDYSDSHRSTPRGGDPLLVLDSATTICA